MEKLTFFCDIDGTLVELVDPFEDVFSGKLKPKPLDGAAEKLMQWHKEGHTIVLTTARPECMRNVTEIMLSDYGMIYDKLIMGIGSGPRILINDRIEDSSLTKFDVKAIAVNVKRDYGIKDMEIFPYQLSEDNPYSTAVVSNNPIKYPRYPRY